MTSFNTTLLIIKLTYLVEAAKTLGLTMKVLKCLVNAKGAQLDHQPQRCIQQLYATVSQKKKKKKKHRNSHNIVHQVLQSVCSLIYLYQIKQSKVFGVSQLCSRF